MAFDGRVYLITNLINGKVYVGQTTLSTKARWRFHRSDARRTKGSLLHKAIRKYGDTNFSISTLESGFANQAALDQAEISWIVRMHSTERTHGYNLAGGGMGGKPSRSTRDLLSQKRRQFLSDPNERAIMRERQIANWANPTWRAMVHAAMTAPGVQARRIARITGSRRTSEERAKISGATRRAMATPVVRARHLAGVRKSLADPAKKAALLARLQSPQAKAKRQAKLKGRKMSAEERARRSAAAQICMKDPVVRAKISAAKMGHPVSEATRAKLSAIFTGRKMSRAARAKIGATSKKRAESSEAKASIPGTRE